ncbi:4Fe-4S dicluster domain-containing protein [Rhabdonatronobacter sediminivivens]
MPALDAIAERAAAHRLMVMGHCAVEPGDGLPEGFATLVLLGPAEPGFWPHVTAEPEFSDGHADPLDRWSRRVIGRLACALGGKARFPFGGPPHAPFLPWAQRSGRAWSSPVGMLVHDVAGLMVSYRGAIALRDALPPAPPKPSPCKSCAEKPCLNACPVGALGRADGYDTAACHGFLDTRTGMDCMNAGCAVRRACPLSQSYGRISAQSSYHMSLFHP